MKIDDPLGLLTPIVVKGRAIFQKTWKLGINRDQDLPPSIISKWNAWLIELSKIQVGYIPRHYLAGSLAKSVELHVFGACAAISLA